MTFSLRPMLKTGLACCASVTPQARYESVIFVLSHMRAATTALSNVLCSHAQVSGYGETHVSYNNGLSPARLVVNLTLRRAYAPSAPWVFDKVLHDRLDNAPAAAFYKARAIVMVRHPAPAIRSICALAARTGMRDVETPEDAARYYLARTRTLSKHWQSFPDANRFGLSAEALLADPAEMIDRIGDWLNVAPKLTNTYVSHVASQRGGGGDPTRSAGLTRIEALPPQPEPGLPQGLKPDLANACVTAYHDLLALFDRD